MKFLKRIKLLLALWAGFGFAQSICNVPPFLTTSVPPNVLFVIDVSGSMNWSAYNPSPDGRRWCDDDDPDHDPSNGNACGNTYTGSEEGYFIPDRVYRWNSSQRYWEPVDGVTPAPCPDRLRELDTANAYMGSCLNFHLMSRMDLLRWAVTGGRPRQCDYSDEFFSTDCDPRIVCTGTTCVLEAIGAGGLLGSYDPPWDANSGGLMVTRILTPIDRVRGILQDLAEDQARPRFGALFYSDTGPRGPKVYVGDYPYPTSEDSSDNSDQTLHDLTYTHLIRAINRVRPFGGTPTAVAMWEAYDYFAQNDLHNYSNGFTIDPGTYRDPQYVCEDPQNPNTCQPVPCAKNFVILASDGQWNTGGPPGSVTTTCTIDTGFEFQSADPVVPAYRMHVDTLRTLTALGQTYDISVSAVYALGLFLGGTGENSLKHVAIYGSFDNTNNTWPGGTSNYPLLSAIDSGSLCSAGIDDCTVYDDGTPDGDDKGSPCTPIPPSSPDWDRDGDGLPDTFLNARNAIEIKRSLLTFIRDILKRTSAASSVSILSRRGTAGNNVIQAVFYPQKPFPNDNKVDWVGYLYNYWFYFSSTEQSIREDTNLNRILDLDQDYKLDFVIDTAGNLKIDAYDNNNNLVTTYNSLDEVHPIWEAGEILKDTDPSVRIIYTVDTAGNLVEFTVANKAAFSSLLGDTANFPACLSASGDPVDNLINFVRGVHIDGCRDRRVDTAGNTWKLGDIVYSTPAILDYGDFGMVFVGANDGMLHAFRIGALRTDNLSTNQVVRICDEFGGSCTTLEIGKEEWAFIPQNALPYLRELADPNYVHRYFVDLQPYIIRLDTNNDGFPDKVVLIGGMRLGGGCGCTDPACENPPPDVCDPVTNPAGCRGLSAYFALDITDPFSPQFLWEFTHPDLGFSYSGPAHITVGGKHFIMFVSGPTDPCGGSAQELKIFVLEMDSNFNIAKRYVFVGNSTPVVTAGYTVVTSSTLTQFNNSFGGRLFTEGIDSNDDGETEMVFFGVNRRTGGTWQGNIIGVRITGPDPTTWEVIKVFNSAIEPITAKVEHMKCFGMNYIFFGTGRWFFKDDEPGQNAQDTEKLYGVRIDGCLSGGNCNINQAKSSNQACQELQTGNETFSWYVDLAPRDADYFKERLISDPAVTNFDVVFFATTQPTGQICGFGGRSRLWGLNCATGEGLLSTACPGFIAQVPPETTVLLQLSRGNIEQFGRSSFTQEGGRATEFLPGTTPESPPTVPGGGGVRGKIILWMER